eukprot:1658969-Ditylum_brightwellii.AAC.1
MSNNSNNNSNNNTSTDNMSITSIASQHDEQVYPRNEADAEEEEDINPISSPTPKNSNRSENETDN